MNLGDIALRNLKRRKSKAAFVLIGLTIGVSAVVVFSLVEAGIVSVLAGVLGYLLGLGATKIVLLFFAAEGAHAGHGIAVPFDPWLAGAALVLAIVLGLAASFYPARVAARLDPCEALRAL